MNNKTSHVDRFASGLADVTIRWRWLIMLMTLIVVFATASGGRFLEFSNNYRVFFSDENPELLAFEAFQDTYTKNDNIVFIVQAKEEGIFNPRVAEAIERLTEKAWQVPYAIRVDSISNFQHSWANGDDLIVEDLIRDAANLSLEDLDKKQTAALAEPLLKGNLISPDARTTGINVTIQYPQKSITEVPEAANKARAIANEIRQDFPELHIALSGISMLNNAFAEAGQSDVQSLIPLMYLILIAFMVLTLRSVSGTIATVIVIGFSMLTAMGLAGYAGIKLTPISITAPTIILTLAIADSIHVIVSMLSLMREGQDKSTALKNSIRINFMPISITSVTTAIGFLSLNFSDTPPFWHLGNITAMGITAAWIYSLTFLPAIISVLPIKVDQVKSKDARLHLFLGDLADFVITKRGKILWVFGVVAILLISLVPTIQLNDEFVKYFDHRVQFRNDAEFGIKNLNGIYLTEYSVEADSSGGISNPEYLKNLDKFTVWLREQPEVTHVYSYTDIIKRLNRNMHADNAEWYRIPNDRELAAQYLLLYELSLPYGLDLNNRINIDKSATRITTTLQNISTVEIRKFLDRSEEWLRLNTPEYMWAKPTSATVMFAYISQRNVESMLKGNALAIFLIAIIIALSLRSFGLGAMSIIPNAMPILMTFGIWALFVGQVGMAAATVTATSLGIVVDDTVHFLSKYLRARREKGLNKPEAIKYAFQTVGAAIIATTIILTIGFSVLAYSTFLINSQMGLLTAIAIVMALLFDFLLLPALLLLGHNKTEEENEVYKNEATNSTI